ncbi:hypothetical protein AAEO56_01080 [Flavobacterium sp. DGU11]|uniref:Uncharacterized protein n=1 Tax=Flavobacterium arundinis TaxID=3139143 RepID=A0ABU9HRQ2_9FLAO
MSQISNGNIIPKYKIGTTICIDKIKVLDFYDRYIDHRKAHEQWEIYTLKDDSVLILKPSNEPNKIFVDLHLNIEIGFIGKIWFMEFCKDNHSKIKNLRTGIIMPVSDGAIMSDIYTSKSFGIANHFHNNPKDKQIKVVNHRQ